MTEANTAPPPADQVFVDLSDLLEPEWTGLATVAAEIARHFLAFDETTAHFCAGDRVMSRDMVEIALDIGKGGRLSDLWGRGYGEAGRLTDLSPDAIARSGAIYPHFRRGPLRFGRQILVVHDISFATMPELHSEADTRDFRKKLARDCRESDFLLCNSHATKLDVESYFGAPPGRVRVCPLGVRPPPAPAAPPPSVAALPRYALTLGTVEPRKNLELALRCLGQAPELTRALDFLFAGREGWGPSFAQLADAHGCAGLPRVRHLGYVDEALKWALLRGAEFVLYPSLFEGFGLPVAEAMSVGAVVCAGETSGVAELGLRPEFLFDPTDPREFARVLRFTMELSPAARADVSRHNREAARRFSWETFGRTLEDLLVREAL